MKNRATKKPNVLHLARWYPNRYDPMFGLFVRRHLEAASKYTGVTLVYVHPVEKPDTKYKYELTLNTKPFPQIIVYYASEPQTLSFVKLIRFLKAIRLGIGEAKRLSGPFDKTHVHILTRLGAVALLLKYLWRTPYVITEHWSRYQPVTGNYNGFLRKLITKAVVRGAEGITTPSEQLAKSMKQHGLQNKYSILPNVVSPVFFKQYPAKKDKKFRFIHVSCFEDRSKNVSGIIKAVKELSRKRNDFIMTMTGEGMDLERMKRLAAKLNIPGEMLVFTGLLEGERLAAQMARNDALVLFSNYENMPVVINEAFALGIPVIATAVGGIPEVVDGQKGILIPPGDQKALTEAMLQLMDGKYRFDGEQLKAYAREHFSYDAVGKQIAALYNGT